MSSTQRTITVAITLLVAVAAAAIGITGIGLQPSSLPTASATVVRAQHIAHFGNSTKGDKLELTVDFVDLDGQQQTANVVEVRHPDGNSDVNRFIGRQVTVEYQPDDPTDARLLVDRFPRWTMFVVALIALVAAVATIAGLDLLRLGRFVQRRLNVVSR